MTDIVLSTLNARYVHAALGLRYLAANLGELRGREKILEFVLGARPADLVETVLAERPRIVGFGVYIWNVEETTKAVALLKRVAPEVVVVVGGPEASHEVEEQRICVLADYVITGWGDLSFAALCRDVLSGRPPKEKVIAGEQPPLEAIAWPYALYTEEDIAR
ncbi:MAG: cobalamin B12-binding domain-containing protein, partial [Betaproteobacteria bacterium]|nr:cobalamin B12-binding domain-containing protein [Betaproteobacteria bacterium]